MNAVSPLREITRELLGRVGQADLVVGVPCFNNGGTVGQVVAAAAQGLRDRFPGASACIVVVDGDSTADDSREAALAAIKSGGVPGVVGIYRGLPGKGSAVRMVFAAAVLGRAHRLGSIEPGKQADLVVLDAPSPKHLVYHFGVNLVRHVVKHGRVVVRNGQLATTSGTAATPSD
jgi:adenine deaminase